MITLPHISFSPFQGVTVPLLTLLALREIVLLLKRPRQRWRHALQLAFCVAATAAILAPNMVTNAALLVGVGRGADLVLYVVALSFTAATFYFYARYVSLQRQITELVRHLAIANARQANHEP